MPTVPREQNRVGIADVTNAKLQPGDYSGTALQALGVGMQQLGGTGARIAGDLQERQARNDEFEVKKAWNAYAEGARGIRADALGKAEADPQDMLESMTQEYGGLRDWIRSGLKNDRQRGQFDQVIAERFDYDISGAVAGAEQALRRGQDQQSVLLERNAADDAADNPDNPALFDKHLQTGVDSVVARGMAQGDDPAAIGRSTMAYASGIRRRVVQGLTDRDPIAAANRYRLMRDGMTQADRQATEAELFEPLARALATGDVDGLLPKQAPDEAASPLTPGQREDAARKIEAEDWTEARKRYARADLAERGLREERRRKQAADAAKEAALATADRLGSGFTSITELPAAVRSNLDEETDQVLRSLAQTNLDPTPIAPGGEAALMMNIMASENPAAFATEDLRLLRGKMAPEEYDKFVRLQRGGSENQPAAGAVTQWRTVQRFRPELGMSHQTLGARGLRNASASKSDRITFDQNGRPFLGTDGRSLLETTLSPLLHDPAPTKPPPKFDGHPVRLPNGHRVTDDHSDSKLLMSPVTDLKDVAISGRKAGNTYRTLLNNPATAESAFIYINSAIAQNLGQGGRYDYQRKGNHITGFIQLRQFRNVSNFNVGLFMQQTGLYTLEQTLQISGNFARLFSSNYREREPHGLDPQTARWIRNGYNAGRSGVYGNPVK
ncbi:MAG: hypothetical protein P0Y59_16150 [Candidatus Sphingomonas phytovorans]|nr:hypothetical protein [Sphingomonas sp.]WEJ98470.1 MAG: hypothetical protein P0Y59_16150 [Sphingomonas sp.]